MINFATQSFNHIFYQWCKYRNVAYKIGKLNQMMILFWSLTDSCILTDPLSNLKNTLSSSISHRVLDNVMSQIKYSYM
jgi:hypothetical protein